MLPPSEAAAAQAQIAALQRRRSQLVQGVRDRPYVETMLPIIQQQLRNNVPPAQLVAFARERGFPDSAIATAFAQAGVDVSSLEAPAPRQGMTLPSDRPAATPKPTPAAPKPAPATAAPKPAPKPRPKDFYGEEATKERADAAQRRKEEKADAAQRRKEEDAKREADAAAKRRQIYDSFNELYGKK